MENPNQNTLYFYNGVEKCCVRVDVKRKKYYSKFISDMIESERSHDDDLVAQTMWYGMSISKSEYDTGKIHLP